MVGCASDMKTRAKACGTERGPSEGNRPAGGPQAEKTLVSQKRHPQVEDSEEEATQVGVKHVWELRRPEYLTTAHLPPPQGLTVRMPPSLLASLYLCCCSSWALPAVPAAVGLPGWTPRTGEHWLSF